MNYQNASGYYTGPLRIRDFNTSLKSMCDSARDIVASLPDDKKDTATELLWKKLHPEYVILDCPLYSSAVSGYEEIYKREDVRAAGGPIEWMLKNTKYRPYKTGQEVLVDIQSEVIEYSDKFEDCPNYPNALKFIKRDGKLEGIDVRIVRRELPFYSIHADKFDIAMIPDICDHMLHYGYTLVHTVLVTRPMIYNLYSPDMRVVIYTD